MPENALNTLKEKPDDDSVMLQVLAAVERNSGLTQRSLAKELDVALGLAHSYLKRCIKKGYVKISQAPAKRYAYYLTPHGFSEKAKLAAEYLNQSFHFFRYAKQQLQVIIDECVARGWKRIVLVGASDLAEIAVLAASLRDITFVGVIDEVGGGVLGLPVFTLAELPQLNADAVIVTSLNRAQAVYDSLCEIVPAERVLVPRLLRIVSTTTGEE